MKHFYSLVLIALSAVANYAMAQSQIIVQNGNNTRFFNSVQAGVTSANNGDTIYIPGGSWDLGGSILIDKTLHIIGVGYNPDSAKASGICYLTGNINLKLGAGNGSITGIYLLGNFGIDNTNSADDTISNYSFTRNRIQGFFWLSSILSSSLFAENVFDSQVIGGDSPRNVFSNNIFTSIVVNFVNGNVFKNNIFLNSGFAYESHLLNCLFENNIFLSAGFIGFTTNSILNNNLFTENVGLPYNSNVGSNNIINQQQSSIFINQSGNVYDNTHNYHLQPTCPGKNAGADGTDVGIYGGVFPFKEGSIPANPHIAFKKIAGFTDPNGNLQVNFKVSAQER